MTNSPYRAFKDTLVRFANGRHGIRNPFVIAAVEPSIEHRVATRLQTWVTGDEPPARSDAVTVQLIWLDELLPRTAAYRLLVDLGDEIDPAQIETTLQDRLTEEIVSAMLETELDHSDAARQTHIVLLLNLGSLYPFSRASELLDELDRRKVKSTIGIPFPGDLVGGKLNIYGGESRHYYPAHQVDEKIREVDLQ